MMKSASAQVESWIQLARAAEDAGKAEEALEWYGKVLEVDAARCQAWLGKARSAAACSTLFDPRLEEVSEALARAVECVPAARGSEVRIEAAGVLALAATRHHERSAHRLAEYVRSEEAWRDHLKRCAAVVRALESAHALDPGDPAILERIVDTCSEQVRGIAYTAVGDYWIPREKRHGVSRRYESRLRAKIAACAAKLAELRPGYEAPRIENGEAESSD